VLDPYYRDMKKYIHYFRTDKTTYYTRFHLHEMFEFCFVEQGSRESFVEKRIYHLDAGDLLIVNNKEFHMYGVKSHQAQKSILIHFEPSLFNLFSTPDYDLLACFTDRPAGEKNKISLKPEQLEAISCLLHKIEEVYESQAPWSSILLLSFFVELLVAINNAYKRHINQAEPTLIPHKLQPILTYIDANLNGDLSLETLEKNFYINRFHLGRVFRKTIGCNIHEYILLKRIMHAKQLLQNGCNVTEACYRSGFNNYSHFIRIFKKYVGFPPGQYKKELEAQL
jgi:AraC-like DNA-binding protein